MDIWFQLNHWIWWWSKRLLSEIIVILFLLCVNWTKFSTYLQNLKVCCSRTLMQRLPYIKWVVISISWRKYHTPSKSRHRVKYRCLWYLVTAQSLFFDRGRFANSTRFHNIENGDWPNIKYSSVFLSHQG